jgi:hypothetical protein
LILPGRTQCEPIGLFGVKRSAVFGRSANVLECSYNPIGHRLESLQATSNLLHSFWEHFSPFALRVKDITPLHSEEPDGLLPSAMEKFTQEQIQNSPQGASLDQFGLNFAAHRLTCSSDKYRKVLLLWPRPRPQTGTGPSY